VPVRTLDRYVVVESMKPLALALAVVLTALLLERMLRLLDLLANKGGPFALVLKMVGSLVPHYMGLALPAAFFLSVFIVTARFAAHSELDAVFGCGISLQRLVVPLVALGAAFAIFSVILFGYVQPYSRYAYRALVNIAENAAWDTTLEEGVFVTSRGRLTIMADSIDAERGHLEGVFLNRENEDGSTLVTTARSGHLVRSTEVGRYVLKLADGNQLRAGPDPADLTVLAFESLDVELALDDTVPPFRMRGEGERELTLTELWERLDAAGPEGNGIRAEFHARLARAASLLLLPFVAAPFGLAAKRARQAGGVIAAGVVLLVYHHVLQLGASLAELGQIPPVLGVWVPFGLFAAFGFVLFRSVGRHPEGNLLIATLDAIETGLRGLRARFAARARPA